MERFYTFVEIIAMKIKEIISCLEEFAPPVYQESYDNAGLIVGDPGMDVNAVILCLDSTEEVVEEAVRKGAGLIIAHHPIIFSGLKKISHSDYIGRTIIRAIQNNIAIYAIHTNLDHVKGGVNGKIASLLGLRNLEILSPKKNLLRKLVTYVPAAEAEKVRQAIFAAGAGQIGRYDLCSFSMEGTGTFRAGSGASPTVGKEGEYHKEAESRIEVIYNGMKEKALVQALKKAHPYEEVAYDCFALENEHTGVGAGMTGELEKEMEEKDFLQLVKKMFSVPCIRHTAFLKRKVKKVAVCGGSGSFLLKDAIASGSDVFITSDYKYHQFFDATGKILLADIGHYESEQFTKDLLFEVIREKFPTFAVHLSETNTNPVNYL